MERIRTGAGKRGSDTAAVHRGATEGAVDVALGSSSLTVFSVLYNIHDASKVVGW